MKTKRIWVEGSIVVILMVFVIVGICYTQTLPDLSGWNGKSFSFLMRTKGYCQNVADLSWISSNDVVRGTIFLSNWDNVNGTFQARLEYIIDVQLRVVEFPLYYIIGTETNFLAWGFGGTDPTIGFTARVLGRLGAGLEPVSFQTIGGFSFDMVGSEYCAHELEFLGGPRFWGRKNVPLR